jgi:hypothetical protein
LVSAVSTAGLDAVRSWLSPAMMVIFSDRFPKELVIAAGVGGLAWREERLERKLSMGPNTKRKKVEKNEAHDPVLYGVART